MTYHLPVMIQEDSPFDCLAVLVLECMEEGELEQLFHILIAKLSWQAIKLIAEDKPVFRQKELIASSPLLKFARRVWLRLKYVEAEREREWARALMRPLQFVE